MGPNLEGVGFALRSYRGADRSKTRQDLRMSLSNLTLAELTTLRTALLATAGGQVVEYSVPGLSVKRLSPGDALVQLADVLDAIEAKTDPLAGIVDVDFDEPGGDQGRDPLRGLGL